VRPSDKSLPPTEEALAIVRHFKCQVDGDTFSLLEMLRHPELPVDVKIETYMKERPAIPRGHDQRFVLDLLACRQALPLPLKPDGEAWTRDWLSDGLSLLCSTGVPSLEMVSLMVEDLFQMEEISDEEDSDSDHWSDYCLKLGGYMLADPRDIAAVDKEGDDFLRVYHVFRLPLIFRRGAFLAIFSWQLGGKWGGVVGMMDLLKNQPVLAFDFGGCADKENLGVCDMARLSNVQIDDWGWEEDRPVHATVDDQVTESPQRMALLIDVAAGRLTLWHLRQNVLSPTPSASTFLASVSLSPFMGLAGSSLFFALATDSQLDVYENDSFVHVESVRPYPANGVSEPLVRDLFRLPA
jgi:hypothetical protein